MLRQHGSPGASGPGVLGAHVNARGSASMRGAVAPLAGLLMLVAAALAPQGRSLAQDSAAPSAAPPAAQQAAMQVTLRPDQVALLQRTLAQADTQGFAHD